MSAGLLRVYLLSEQVCGWTLGNEPSSVKIDRSVRSVNNKQRKIVTIKI